MVAVTLLSGCGEKENELRIGYFPNITHSQAFVMLEQGNLERKLEGKCEVSWTSFNAGPAEVEALFAGELDIGFIEAVNAFLEEFYAATEYVATGGDEVKQLVSNRIRKETGKEYETDIVSNAFANIEFTTYIPTDSLNGYGEIMFNEEFITELPDTNLVYEATVQPMTRNLADGSWKKE